MREAENELLDAEDAHKLLKERMGKLAPACDTFRTWLRPSAASRFPTITPFLPKPVKLPGKRRFLYRRGDVELLASNLTKAAAPPPARSATA